MRGIVDKTVYALSDLHSGELNTHKAEAQQIRSFQFAIEKLRRNPGLAALYIHKPGPLSDENPIRQNALADVFRRGFAEIDVLLAGVQTRPS